MATYIPGIQEYIPQVQPFKPDFNFFQSALEMKQAQYQAGYNKISAAYGQLLNSELLRQDNIDRRDNFFTEIDSEIKRLSGVDLSLVENQQQAYSLFQPLIDNQYFRKDLAYSKTYNGQLRRAQNLKNNPDPKNEEKYWDEGVTALQYQAADFANSSDDDSLLFSNPEFTPYIDAVKKLFDFAKEYNINPENISFDKGYIVRYANGGKAIPELNSIFSSVLLADPRIKKMFRTEAYLERKNYMRSNAEKFGGDESAAEMEYLTARAKQINQYYAEINEKDENKSTEIKNKRILIEEKIRKNGVDPDIDSDLIDAYRNINSDAAVQSVVVNKNKEALSTFDGIDFESMDRESLRNRIDNVMSYFLLDDFSSKTAQQYAFAKQKILDIQADPYSLENVKFKHQLALVNARGDIDKTLKIMDIAYKILEASGNGLPGGISGLSGAVISKEPGQGGVSLGAVDVFEQNKALGEAHIEKGKTGLLSALDKYVNYNNALIKSGTPADKQAAIERLEKLGLYQEVERSPEITVDKKTDWGQALGGAAAVAIGQPLNFLLPGAGFGMGLSGASNLKEGFAGKETIPSKVTQSAGLLEKDTDGTYKLVSKDKLVSLSDPNSSDYLFNVYDNLIGQLKELAPVYKTDGQFLNLLGEINSSTQGLDISRELIAAVTEANIENNAIIQPALANEAGVDSKIASLFFTGSKSRPVTENEFVQSYINAYRRDTDKYPTSYLDLAIKTKRVSPGMPTGPISEKERLEDMTDDAQDLYEDLKDAYETLKKNPDANLNLKSSSTKLASDQGITKYFANYIKYFADPVLYNTEEFGILADFFKKDYSPNFNNSAALTRSGMKVVFGDGINITANNYDDDAFKHNTKAASDLNFLLSSFLTPRGKNLINDPKRPIIEYDLHAIPANDANKVAITLKPSPSFVESVLKSGQKEGLFSGLNNQISAGEVPSITVFMNADQAQSYGFTEMQNTPIESIINLKGSLPVTNPNAGTVTITPGQFGGYNFTGSAMSINQNGERIQNPVFGNGNDVNQLYASIFSVLDEISRANNFSLSNISQASTRKIRNPEELPQ